MSNTILFRIIVPSKIIAEYQVNMVNIPGREGVFGVLPSHAPFISNIKIGLISVFMHSSEKKYFVYGGVADIRGMELNIVTEFAIDLENFSNTQALNIIIDYKNQLFVQEQNSLEVSIIKEKIRKYESLIEFI